MEKNQAGDILQKLRQQDMVDWLASLGFQPQKVRNNDYWYCSPLREEQKPSFKINRRLNVWYDHGIGAGGNLIDFAIRFHNCTVGDLIKLAKTSSSFHVPALVTKTYSKAEKENLITVLDEKALTSYPLFNYLHQRRISSRVAHQFCREVTFEIKGKKQYAIGFKNDAGGYELRNQYFKGCSSPKGVTTLQNGAATVAVFEGFFDFLTFIELLLTTSLQEYDFLILNSLSLFEKSRPFMEQHDSIRLYLDRDLSGQNCSYYALSLSDKYSDQSTLYSKHKDLNDWATHFGCS